MKEGGVFGLVGLGCLLRFLIRESIVVNWKLVFLEMRWIPLSLTSLAVKLGGNSGSQGDEIPIRRLARGGRPWPRTSQILFRDRRFGLRCVRLVLRLWLLGRRRPCRGCLRVLGENQMDPDSNRLVGTSRQLGTAIAFFSLVCGLYIQVGV